MSPKKTPAPPVVPRRSRARKLPSTRAPNPSRESGPDRPPPRSAPSTDASPARLAAARALLEVEEGDHLDDALARLAPRTPRDRGLAWFLALGVLQRRGQVDAALRPFLRQPLGGLDPELRVSLRLGTFEKLFGRAAPHAVVHQAVEVVRALGLGRASGMVNAVLRKVRPAQDLAPHEGADHPAWLWARWVERYGESAARAWCEQNGRPAPLAVVFRGPQGPLVERWVAEGLKVEHALAAGEPVPGAALLFGHQGSITELPGFDEGAFWVQDPAAVAVADLVGAAPGQRVLDACASPGGKTLRLIEAGAHVTAVDRPARLGRLRESLERTKSHAEVVAHDWSKGPASLPRDFDAVLVDAPCTGLGTVRRHPEIRWRRQPLDLIHAAQEQREILRAAAHHVRPGGVLVYAVCSAEPEEGDEVVRAFLRDHPDFEVEATLNTDPPSHEEDAHVGVRLRRAASVELKARA
ncbi:MAG: hypothetical protein EA397_05135 [Deltaproteobacteria bacterium]|nr:MAG: hypothetical protein EA397_05135 [Deltaproteobacteria bacterium]